jgi:zinc protease
MLLIPVHSIAQKSTANIPDIAYEKFVLDNGLTLVVHQDSKAPIVAVNVWYHVGSKNEPDGRSGFAHLFEHLMFNGTENYDDEYFKPLEKVGATDLNGTTNFDRTNYFQNVPKNALDLALWMESERMGHLLGAISQEKLDEQRGVVQNEKRQGENQPYGQVYNRIIASAFPEGHPYDHTVIGSMDDLNAATLDDVKDWFKRYYGPNNATIVVAGDVTPEEARERVEHFFGDIAPADPIHKYTSWIAKREGSQREIMEDRVPQARVHMVWNIPGITHNDSQYLDLVSDVLASGKNSRLYKRLVYDDQIATDVSAYKWQMEIAGLFVIQATAKPGQSLASVESAIREELQQLLDQGPTAKELERVKTKYQANFIRGIERIGGFGGKSDILAEHEVYFGSPDAYKQRLELVNNATSGQLQNAAVNWLNDGDYTLEVHPYPELMAASEGADRSKLPDTGDFPIADFPELQRTTLSNGLEVVLAQRSSVPMVQFNLLVDAGYASDQYATPGTASLAMNAMDEGTKTRSALEISAALDDLGANLSTTSDLDMSYVSLSTLTKTMEPSLEIFADVILNPSFPDSEVERLKREQLARIQREKQTPIQMAVRVFPRLLYGEDHAYSNPLTGSGTEATVSVMTSDDLVEFHQTWFRPNNATLVVAGDIAMDELKPQLETLFADWSQGDIPAKNIATVQYPPQSRVYLMDRPGSQQSIIFAGHVAPPKSAPNDLSIDAMNTIFGGTFTARINMNLREDKGWSYGASSLILDAKGQRPWIIYAPVQTDKTSESMQEIMAELSSFTGDNPATSEELSKTKDNKTLTLPGRFETISAVGGGVSNIVRFGLPDDYYDTYSDAVRSLTLNEITDATRKVIKKDQLTWVVVGDRAVIEPAIRKLGLQQIQVIDSNGQVLSVTQ